MTECNASENPFQDDFFPNVKTRRIEAAFNGGNVSGDGGALLLRQVDRKIKLLGRASKMLDRHDNRQKWKTEHGTYGMLVQRVFGIGCGYEDLNDHNELRHDIVWQTAAGEDSELASAPTLCRFENRATRRMCMELSRPLIDVFIESFEKEPGEIILDFDNTDDRIHGKQEGRFFHGCYDEYCFLPLYVFCGEKLVAALLQPSSEDGAKHAGAVLKMIVLKLREKWPSLKIACRGDSGFARPRHLYWCERNNVQYIVGMARNATLESELDPLLAEAEREYGQSGTGVRKYTSFKYSAGSWHGRERKVVGKAEFNEHGRNPRFVLTTREGDPGDIYEKEFCPRGGMENRIKERKLGLFSDRTSAHKWWTNQFRLTISSLAYVLFERMRNLALKGTELAEAQVGTIRLKLMKIGTVVRRNTRKIQFSLSSSFPYKSIFWRIAGIFSSG